MSMSIAFRSLPARMSRNYDSCLATLHYQGKVLTSGKPPLYLRRLHSSAPLSPLLLPLLLPPLPPIVAVWSDAEPVTG
jgi:hypothetical protein